MVTQLAKHLTTEELEAGLGAIQRAPSSDGVVELIVRRPAEGEREVLEQGTLDLLEGLVGDTWRSAEASAPPTAPRIRTCS